MLILPCALGDKNKPIAAKGSRAGDSVPLDKSRPLEEVKRDAGEKVCIPVALALAANGRLYAVVVVAAARGIGGGFILWKVSGIIIHEGVRDYARYHESEFAMILYDRVRSFIFVFSF